MKEQQSVKTLLASNIKRFRLEQNLTQAELAELTDLSNTYIANIECGKTWISDSTLEKLSIALNTDFPSFFMTNASQTKKESVPINSIIQKYKRQIQQNNEAIFKSLQKELHEQ